jgi:hypothetical protein
VRRENGGVQGGHDEEMRRWVILLLGRGAGVLILLEVYGEVS